MTDPPAKFTHGDYTVGWICALPETELVAAMAMLDERHPNLPATDPHDANSYVLGRIGDHNVVIACLPAAITGKVSAATVAKDMIRSFPAVRFGLMVGIGGGAPYYGATGNDDHAADEDEEEDSEESEDDPEDIRDIRLGDVVISLPSKSSDAVVQYDFGKSLQQKDFVHTGGKLNKPPSIVLGAVARLKALHELEGHNISETLANMMSRYPALVTKFQYPVSKKDRLFKSTIVHDEGEKSCESCCGPQNCNLVQRKYRPNNSPQLHYGTIGSADQVMKDAILRDKWAQEESIICFEMEAAGLMDSFPCLVIRGISDYADSHKNKAWQPYAAATAASYAKELLLVIPGLGVEKMDPIKQIEKSIREIHDVVQETGVVVQNLSNDSRHEKVFRKLPYAKGSSFDASDAEHEARCHPKTRIGLLHQIQEWAEDPSQKCIFWLNGMAGTGKSTISRTIAHYFKVKGQLGASFFFKRGERDRGTAKMFFTTICAQLLLQVPALIHHVEMAIDTDPYISGKLMKEQFDKLLLQPLLRLNQSEAITIMIVIDALDECEHGSDIRAILQLLPQVQKSKSIRLRIFLTSRPELAIRLGFNQDISYQDLVLHELPKPEIEHDIRVYLEDELSKIRDERSFSNDWPGNKAIKELVQMAVPLFIFAATACRFIKEGIHPKKRLQDFLQFQVTSSASQMGKLYLPVLNQLMGDKEDGPKELLEEFQDVVGVIILLATPLSVKSLARLLDLPEQTISELLDPLHSVLNIPSDKDAPIRILHLSFRDYLLTTESLFHIDEKKTHQKIALHCLRVMNTSLKHNICGLPSYGTQRNDIDSQAVNQNLSADLQYACQYWVYHLNQSEDRIAESQIFAFLKQHFLHWLEALSLMSVISEAVTMTDLLQSGGRNDTDSEFSYFLYDAKRFTLKNTYIASIAPLQLYCSGLVFSPMQSAIRRIFSDSRPKQLSILPQVEDYWNPGLQTLEGHSAQVSSIAFSPNGQTLASGSHDGTIKLWDTKTGSELQTLKGYSGWVHSISFSSDSQIVASSSGNCIIKLWDVKAGSELQILKGHSAGIHSITFSSKGQILASGSFDHTIKFWDIKTGSELRTLKGHSDWVLSIAFSSDGQILASGSSDHTIKLWCAKTGSELRTLEGHSAQVSSIAFSSNSQMVASGSGDRTIKLWDVKTGSELRTLKGHSDWVLSIAFSSDGQTMASGSDDHTIKLWDARTGSELQTLRGHSDSVSSIAFSSDSQMVASGSHDNTIKLWDAKASSKLHTLKGHSDRVWSMAFSSDSQMVASGSHDHTIKLWDAKTGSELRTFKGHSDRVSSVAFSLDGRMVASGSGDHTIKLWDAKTGYELRTLKGHSNLVSSIDFSSDSQTIVSGSTDRTVKFWDIKTGSELQTFKASSDWVSSISLDSQMVTSRSHDNTIELSDAKTSSKLQTLKGHLDRIWSKLWDAKTSSELQTLKGHSDLVSSITFSSDVRTVTSVSLSDNWVSLAGENLLWLPPEHRQFTASTVKEANLALGYSDGRVSIIGFHTP